MDGVLTIYEIEAFRGEDPLFMSIDSHYFANAPVDKVGLGILKYLNEAHDYSILTRLVEDTRTRMCHYNDKLLWLFANAPYAVNKYMTCVCKKSEYVKTVKGVDRLSPEDILIDDYYKNLLDWQENGGTAIKYVTDANRNAVWNGYSISDVESLRDILNSLRGVLYVKSQEVY